MNQSSKTNPFHKLHRKNKRQHELKNAETHKQDVAQESLKRKLIEETAYDQGDDQAIEIALTLPRPMTLVLSELKENSDGRIVHSDLVSRGRYQLTTKKQKRSSGRETDSYLAKRPLCQLLEWQEGVHLFMENREADREHIGTRGGMLCLDMGLGKTICSLTYLLYDNQRCFRQTGNRYNGCTLIAVPNKLIGEGWLYEVRTKWSSNSFEYYVLQNTKNKFISRVYIENCCDFLIVTYTTISAAYRYRLKKMANHIDEQEDTEEDDEEVDLDNANDKDEEEEEEAKVIKDGIDANTKRLREQEYRSDVLYNIHWKRIIADESHSFVNKRTFLYKAMMALHSDVNWAVTGTPVQNKLSDVCSNFDFIGVPPVIPTLNHRTAIKDSDVSDEDRGRIIKMLDIVMVRIQKSEINKLDGKMMMMPIVKTIMLIEFESLAEKVIYYLYAGYGSRNWRSGLNNEDDDCKKYANKKNKNTTSIASILQLMMQLCVGIRIVKDLVLPNGMLTMGDESQLHLRETHYKEAILEKPLNKLGYAHDDNTLEFFASRIAKKTTFNYKSNNDIVVSVPDGYNLEYYRSLQSVPERSLENAEPMQEKLEWDPFKKDKYFDLTNSQQDREEYVALYERLRVDGVQSAKTMIREAKEIHNRKKQAMVSHILARSLRPSHYSTKNRYILKYIREKVPIDDKVIVFANSIRSLECLERDLASAGITSIMVNGKTVDNIERIARFKESCPVTGIKVLLLSLKLGNMGLNITCANHIIFLHPWWNPHMIQQAIDRAHRIGQLKIVYILHFIMNGTIDLHVLNLAHNKKFMTTSIIEREKQQAQVQSMKKRIEQYAYSLYEYSITQ